MFVQISWLDRYKFWSMIELVSLKTEKTDDLLSWVWCLSLLLLSEIFLDIKHVYVMIVMIPCKKLWVLTMLPFLLSLLHWAIACTYASLCTPSLTHIINSTHHFCLQHLLPGTLEWRKSKKDQKYQIEQLINFL